MNANFFFVFACTIASVIFMTRAVVKRDGASWKLNFDLDMDDRALWAFFAFLFTAIVLICTLLDENFSGLHVGRVTFGAATILAGFPTFTERWSTFMNICAGWHIIFMFVGLIDIIVLWW